MSRMTYAPHGGGAALGKRTVATRARKARGDPHPEKCLQIQVVKGCQMKLSNSGGQMWSNPPPQLIHHIHHKRSDPAACWEADVEGGAGDTAGAVQDQPVNYLLHA
eukprot:4202869-Prymnesium_polylepis.1